MISLQMISKEMPTGVGEFTYPVQTFYNGETQAPSDNRNVFAFMLEQDYKTREYTKEISCIACFVHKNKIEADSFFEDDYYDWEDVCDYDEEKDIWYVGEGWYSVPLFDEPIYPIKVSRWMEIPR